MAAAQQKEKEAAKALAASAASNEAKGTPLPNKLLTKVATNGVGRHSVKSNGSTKSVRSNSTHPPHTTLSTSSSSQKSTRLSRSPVRAL